MAAEDAMEEDDDDVDFNPFLQHSPSLDGASGDSSDGEGEVEEAEDEVELEVQEENLSKEDLQFSEKETEREKDLDEDDFLELASDEYDEEEFEDEEQDEMLQSGGGNSELEDYYTMSVLLEKDGKHVLVRRRPVVDEYDKNGVDAGAGSSDPNADEVQQCNEAVESLCLTRNLGSSRPSHAFQYETETGTPGQSVETLPELRIFRRATQSGEILRGDNSEDLGDDSVDAISKRTRAHYSLADMSLDQLEMFLQESDEEEYFQNVDDEEEYRKFLLAVQEKQDESDEQSQRQGRKEDEDDEEEDADFEFEIEEVLESDYDDASGFTKKRKSRRPETRENRRQRTKTHSKGLHLSQSKAPLRPLLPHTSNLQYNALLSEKRKLADVGDQVWAPTLKKKVPVNGFTAHQIGQLYCLIHEHVQLLVQVYSMCILEPTRQQIAIDTRRMLTEMVDKRDLLLSWKKTAFPDFCFRPPYTHPSFTESEEEKTLSHGFQLPNDRSNLAMCSRDTSGGPDSYSITLSHSSHGERVSWRSFGSASSTSIVPLGQTNTLFSSNIGLVSQPCLYPGSIDSTPFLQDHPSELSHSWHNKFNISQTPGAGQTKLQAGDTTHLADPSSESTFVDVGTCYGEGVSTGTKLIKSVPPATAHIPSSCSSATSVKTAQSFSVSAEGHGCVHAISSEWAPATSGPVRSLLDVAPLALVREFLNDMSRVAEDYRKRHVESGAYHSQCEREPLFMTSISDHHEGDTRRNTKARPSSFSLNGEAMPVSAPRIQIKKTMAAALVESTKKESLALVPKDVANAVQRFLPFFNEALFPHKPPPIAAANRLLFTDAEDELLAMGLMMYNTDWTSIQQRFLPSKSMHQIFVRQKNRSSARAPENSIKAVRRMKSSPLTAVERARIQEGLKIYKYDWKKVREFCVPHRDPAVLPRQWRIALGTQKSYKTSETSKERRRLYEANRRQAKKASEYGLERKKDSGPSSVECIRDVISGEEDGYDEDAYIREAFLADWCPSKAASVGASLSPLGGPHAQRPKTKSSVSKKRKAHLDQVPDAKPVSAVPSFNVAPGSSAWFNRQALMFGTNMAKQTVKLAPDLPSVKLPPHVHVLSQALVPTIPQLPSAAAMEFQANSVASRWSHITGQKWSSMTGQSFDRTVPMNPPCYLSSTFSPKIVSGRPPSHGSKQNCRFNSKPTPLPTEHARISSTQSVSQQDELPGANEAASSFVTVDLQRLAKDLDKQFGISQPLPSIDLKQTDAPVRPLAGLAQADGFSVNPLPSEETFPASSFGHRFPPVSGTTGGSGLTSFVKSNRLSSRKRKERAPVVSSNSSNMQHISTRLDALSTETQQCDLPQPCPQAVSSSQPTVGREGQLSSTPALSKSDCKTGSPSKSDVPSKVTKTFPVGVGDQVETEPVEPSHPSSRQKDQDAPVRGRGPLSKKSIAKKSRKLAPVKQTGRGKQNGNKQGTDTALHGFTQVQAEGCLSPKSCQPMADEAGLTRGQKRRKQKTQEKVEARIEDPHLESHVIVMEQEELSDSEDEAGIGVEFEHEEMGDSDKDSELELSASNQKESSIEFEEEEIESDKEKDEYSHAGERITERLREGLSFTPAGSSHADVLRRCRRMQVQGSTKDLRNKALSFRTETLEDVPMITEIPGDRTKSMTNRENSPDLEGKQAERTTRSRARAKSIGFELKPGSSHQVHQRRGHDLEKNVGQREEKKTEAEVEFASDAAEEILAVSHQVPAMPRE